MQFSRLGAALVAVAATSFALSASAVPINVGFNVAAFGTFTSDTGDITTATTISSGAPLFVGAIIANNINLLPFAPVTLSPAGALPLTVGGVFTKTFDTSFGTFIETLTVTARTAGPSSLGILAVGTITGGGFDPTPVFWSAAYTQNAGPGGQINGSFNNSTTAPPGIPEPASLALAGLALAGLAASRKARKA